MITKTNAMNNPIPIPNTEISDRKASESLARANAIVITTVDDFTAADLFCTGLKSLRGAIEADFAGSEEAARESKKAATEALASIVSQKEKHTLPVFQAEKIIKGKLLAYSEEAEKARQAAEAIAREEARKRAEDEQLRKASALEAQGKTAQAEAVLQKQIKIAPVIVTTSTPKAETIIRKIVRYQITDAVAVKREFCAPAPGLIQKAVQLYGEKAEEIVGGIRVWTEAS